MSVHVRIITVSIMNVLFTVTNMPPNLHGRASSFKGTQGQLFSGKSNDKNEKYLSGTERIRQDKNIYEVKTVPRVMAYGNGTL